MKNKYEHLIAEAQNFYIKVTRIKITVKRKRKDAAPTEYNNKW